MSSSYIHSTQGTGQKPWSIGNVGRVTLSVSFTILKQ